MKQMHRQKAKKQDEAAGAETKDVRDEQLAEETEDLLSEIDCCLAEAATDRDEKHQAKAEWDKIEQDLADGGSRHDYWYRKDAWVEKYRYVIDMKVDCCGVAHPDFSGIE